MSSYYGCEIDRILHMHNCQRVMHLGEGIWLWETSSGRRFTVQRHIPSRIEAEEILAFAGINSTYLDSGGAIRRRRCV